MKRSKQCKSCLKDKSLDKFYPAGYTKKGDPILRADCIECRTLFIENQRCKKSALTDPDRYYECDECGHWNFKALLKCRDCKTLRFPINHKQCNHCREVLSFDMFWISKKSSDGHMHDCKSCIVLKRG